MYGLVHEVHGPDGMVEAGMQGPGIHQVGHAQLTDPPQALEPGMLDKVEEQRVANGDEAVYRVVEYFSAAEGRMPHRCIIFV